MQLEKLRYMLTACAMDREMDMSVLIMLHWVTISVNASREPVV